VCFNGATDVFLYVSSKIHSTRISTTGNILICVAQFLVIQAQLNQNLILMAYVTE
jgi:hypothetical protein